MRFVSSLAFRCLATSTAIVLGSSALVGCVEKETDKVDEGYVKDNLLSAAPTPKHPSNAELAGKVVYLGADVDKETAMPGDRIKVTHYWKCLEPLGSEWRPFTHLNGNTGGEWINIDKTKMRDNYPAENWKAGDIIRDEQVIPIPAGWKSTEATVYVGLFRKGGHGEADRAVVTAGPSDGHNRAISVKVTIPQKGGAQSQPASSPVAPGQPTYVIRRATGPIKIDGKADEPDWANAPSSGLFKATGGGDQPEDAVSARLLYDDKNLYVFVDVADTDIVLPPKKPGQMSKTFDSIELLIDADRNGHGYIALEVYPNNTSHAAWFADTRAAGPGDMKWDSHMLTAVNVEGTLDKRGDVDKAWHAELAIPLEAVKGKDAAMAVRLPPKPGDSWDLNILRSYTPSEKKVLSSAWAKRGLSLSAPDLDKVVLVTFGDANGQLAAPTPAPASVPAAPRKPLPHMVPRPKAPGGANHN